MTRSWPNATQSKNLRVCRSLLDDLQASFQSVLASTPEFGTALLNDYMMLNHSDAVKRYHVRALKDWKLINNICVVTRTELLEGLLVTFRSECKMITIKVNGSNEAMD